MGPFLRQSLQDFPVYKEGLVTKFSFNNSIPFLLFAPSLSPFPSQLPHLADFLILE